MSAQVLGANAAEQGSALVRRRGSAPVRYLESEIRNEYDASGAWCQASIATIAWRWISSKAKAEPGTSLSRSDGAWMH